MSFQAKRELLARVGPRYQEAKRQHKAQILNEFVAATGYDRKYAIRLLAAPVRPLNPIQRPRPRRYGPAVEAALRIAWEAANGICSKRLIPFLPELVPTLERHGHLTLTDELRTQLLALSPATADRLLRPQRPQGRGISTTKPGALLKHQVPIRTFAEWNDVRPGFLEADLVAHCGGSAEGAFLYTLTLTDVATGWTECQALLFRTQHAVVEALGRARRLLPFALLGLDTDNGSEFLNAELLAYCTEQQITFTRGRTAKKNDQCFVEQKNGSVVRALVGYDRFEGEQAYRQLAELYRAVRLYVNFFQPSLKLRSKQRDGARVRRQYEPAQTPFQRVLASACLSAVDRERLKQLYQALDPVRLRQQLHTLQDALWRHAIVRTPIVAPAPAADAVTVQFNVAACSGAGTEREPSAQRVPAPAGNMGRRSYHRTAKPPVPRWWRTRADPFAAAWPEIEQWLRAAPARTAKSVFQELQQRAPDQYPDIQLRTLQRRVKVWRASIVLTFDEQWLNDEVLAGQTLPRPLQAQPPHPAIPEPVAAGAAPR